MPETGNVALAKFTTVSPGTSYMRYAVWIPIRSSGRSGHALTTIVADLLLIGLAGNVRGLTVDAAVIARIVVEHHVRKGQGLTARRWTEDRGGWNLSCVNAILVVDLRWLADRVISF